MKTIAATLGRLYHWLLQPLLVLMILLLGYFGAKGLTVFKQEPEKTKPASYAPLVKTVNSRLENKTLTIRGNGTIEARTRINIVPQVAGRVIRIHPQLRAGGYFQANQVLLAIEPIDYQLAVTNAESELATARRSLQLEVAEAQAAVEEWHALHPNQAVPLLVGRQPQIAEARASLKAAKARLQQARLNLKRTKISMPFAGRVVESNIDVGEVVSANQSVGIVYSNDVFEIPVPIEVDQMAWLDIQSPNPDSAVSSAESHFADNSVDILVPIAAEIHRLPGRLVRVESELDSVSRLARVVVALKSADIPKQLREEVIPGLFVDVEIRARELQHMTLLPRQALREGDVLWTVNDGKLVFVQAQIIHRSDSEIWLQSLPEDTVVVISALDVATEGMQVRVMEQQ